MKRSVRCMVLGVLALLMSCAAYAQNAQISGEVTDPQKAAVPNAEVRIVNQATGVETKTKTNATGLYSVPYLIPGTYRIYVQAQGFETVASTDVVVTVGQVLVMSFQLRIGSGSEQVTVSGEARDINTTDASVSTIVDRQFAENLPMNGRSFQTLIELTPGVVLSANFNSGSDFNVNGQRGTANYWMVDGVGANVGMGSVVPTYGVGGAQGSFSSLGGTNGLVSVDAMQEFRIQTSTYAPEFGRTPGGQISIVTRSGTNSWHGTAFDYLRNDKLDANDWFADSVGLPKPEERQNDFGGTFSGPILKDRTFFFFSYEGLRLRLPQVAKGYVPDLAARQDALPVLQPYLNAYPIPNGADNPATGQAEYNASFSNAATLNAYSIRVDHKFNDKFNLFGRFNNSPSDSIPRGYTGTTVNTIFNNPINTQTTTIGLTWAKSATIANDLRFNYSHTHSSSFGYMDGYGGGVPLTSAPFPSPYTLKNSSFFYSIPSLGGLSAVSYDYLGLGKFGDNQQRQINVVDSLTYQKGPHSLKFGVDWRRLMPVFDAPAYSQQVGFADVPAAETGLAEYAYSLTTVNSSFVFNDLGAYAQDTWRTTPRLTLTYGIRWDVSFAPYATSGADFAAVTGYNPNNLSTLALAPPGTAAYHTRYANFAPRLGVAYQLRKSANWQTVVRTGFGVFYDLPTSEIGANLYYYAYPFGSLNLYSGVTFPLTPQEAAPPPVSASNLASSDLYSTDPNLKDPYTLEWNLAIEQALGNSQTVTVSYIGSAGHRLLDQAVIQQPNPSIFGAILYTNGGYSDYNSMQVQYQRRLSHGLQTLLSYTWAHSTDTASLGEASTTSAVFPNHGSSDYDIRNQFSGAITYDFPTPKINAFTKAILGGWSTENIIQARSALPVDVIDLDYYYLPGTTISGLVRPDVVQGQPFWLYGSQYPGGKAINPNAFADPPGNPLTQTAARNGNLGRNALRGFGLTQWDFAVHRDFSMAKLRESMKLQFRAEMFNVLNHPNFGAPNADFAASNSLFYPGGYPGFGLASQTLAQSLNSYYQGLNPLFQTGGPRSIQLALKLFF